MICFTPEIVEDSYLDVVTWSHSQEGRYGLGLKIGLPNKTVCFHIYIVLVLFFHSCSPYKPIRPFLT